MGYGKVSTSLEGGAGASQTLYKAKTSARRYVRSNVITAVVFDLDLGSSRNRKSFTRYPLDAGLYRVFAFCIFEQLRSNPAYIYLDVNGVRTYVGRGATSESTVLHRAPLIADAPLELTEPSDLSIFVGADYNSYLNPDSYLVVTQL